MGIRDTELICVFYPIPMQIMQRTCSLLPPGTRSPARPSSPFSASSARRSAWSLLQGSRPGTDAHKRLVLVPSRYEPEDLFRHRPPVGRVMRLGGMEQAITATEDSPDP